MEKYLNISVIAHEMSQMEPVESDNESQKTKTCIIIK